METLIINIPESKSTLVKQILMELGVTITKSSRTTTSEYKNKLAKTSTWNEEDFTSLKIAEKSFGNLKPDQW